MTGPCWKQARKTPGSFLLVQGFFSGGFRGYFRFTRFRVVRGLRGIRIPRACREWHAKTRAKQCMNTREGCIYLGLEKGIRALHFGLPPRRNPHYRRPSHHRSLNPKPFFAKNLNPKNQNPYTNIGTHRICRPPPPPLNPNPKP